MLADQIAVPVQLVDFVRRMECQKQRLNADRMDSLLCRGCSCSGSLPVAEGMSENTTFSDDTRKQLVGGHIERRVEGLSLIHISEPTRLGMISYAVFCLK